LSLAAAARLLGVGVPRGGPPGCCAHKALARRPDTIAAIENTFRMIFLPCVPDIVGLQVG
jgi:hypothetical protein